MEFKIKTQMNLNSELFSCECVREPTRDGWGRELARLGGEDERVVALTADLSSSVRTNWFEEKCPKRFFNCGVAEQNMASVAAGLALCGKIVYFSSFAAFSPGRNWDQIRVNIAYNNLDVKFSGAHAGITTGPDGATHQALEDVALMRALPNVAVIVPADSKQAEKAVRAAYVRKGPAYIRLGRENIPVFTTETTPFEIGKINVLKDGKDIAIIACGVEVYEALLAAKKLAEKGIDAAVLDCHTIKPLDSETISRYAKKCKMLAVCEEHQINGGLASAVCETVCEECPVPVLRIGIDDKFGESGNGPELLKEYGLDSDAIFRRCEKFIRANGAK